jgi:uncharacterized RDD family membrane protein YckC
MSAIPRPIPSANPYAPPRARVRDVVRPKAALVLAERWPRLGASLVDGLIFSAMVYGPMLGGLALGAAFSAPGSDGSVALALSAGLTLIGLVVWSWLTLKQMGETGQSLAKKYFNIKVVRSDGSPASLSNLIWRRNVITWVLNIIPFYGFVEVLFIFGEKRQCLHDKMADTIVVEA